MHVTLCDVGPRDGLQNDKVSLEPAVRAELVRPPGRDRPAAHRVRELRQPEGRAADGRRGGGLRRRSSASTASSTPALALNGRGVERAVAAGADEVHLAYPLSDTFCARNQNTTLADAAAAHESMIAAAHAAGRARERDAGRVASAARSKAPCPRRA